MRTNASSISSTSTGNRFTPPFRSAWRDIPARVVDQPPPLLFAGGACGFRRMVVWSLTCGLADLPRVAHALLELDLPCLHEGSVVSLRDLHRRVPEEYRDLIDGNSGEQHL